MKPRFLITFVTALIAVFFAAASGVAGETGTKDGDGEKTIGRYKERLEKSPNKSDLWRKLGITYFQLERYDEAMEALTKAGSLDPDDAASVVYRGMIHEQRGQLDQAKNLYQSYLAFGKQDRLAQEIRYRLRWIEDNQLKQMVDSAVSNEKNVKIADIAKSSIAVIRFNSDSLSPQLKPLARGLAELIYTDLSYVPDLKLVERLELARLQQELKLSQSEFSDKFHAPRIGKIVGAAKIITGQVTESIGDQISIDCGIIDVGPGLAEYPDRQQGKLNYVFVMQKRLSLSIISKLGYEITPAIKNRIDKSPTESFLALLAYSRGLDYADQGLYPLAEAEFNAALSEDPHFDLAKKSLDKYSGLSNYNGNLKPLPQITGLVTEKTGTEEKKATNRGEIIGRLQNVTRGTMPTGDTPYVTPQASRGKVIITGRTENK
jgi:tetratricopeptide (TPR) repeat protein